MMTVLAYFMSAAFGIASVIASINDDQTSWSLIILSTSWFGIGMLCEIERKLTMREIERDLRKRGGV